MSQVGVPRSGWFLRLVARPVPTAALLLLILIVAAVVLRWALARFAPEPGAA